MESRALTATMAIVSLLAAGAIAGTTAATTPDGTVTVQVTHDDVADSDTDVGAQVTAVSTKDGNGDTDLNEATDSSKTKIKTKAPGNTGQSPQTKKVTNTSEWVDNGGTKRKVTVRMTITYTWDAEDHEWNLDWTITGITVLNLDRSSVASELLTGLNAGGEFDIASISGLQLTVELSDGNGGWQTPVQYGLAAGPHAISLGDVDGDGHLDLAVSCESTKLVRIFVNDGSGGFDSSDVTLGSSDEPSDVVLVDCDGDDDLDLVAACPGTASVRVFSNDGDGSFTALGTVSVNLPELDGDEISIVEADGDAALEWAVADDTADEIAIYGGITLLTTLDPGGVIEWFGDTHFDENGTSDFAIWDSTNNRIVVAIGDEEGTYTPAVHSITLGAIASVELVDADADDDIDILVHTASGTVELLNDGDGVFSEA